MMTKENIEETINISYYANKRKRTTTKTMTKSKVETINIVATIKLFYSYEVVNIKDNNLLLLFQDDH